MSDEPASGAIGPVLTHSHSSGWCSITGGYVVRDSALPALDGSYVYGDYCQGVVRRVRLGPGSASGDRALGVRHVSQLSSFGEDGRGRVYVLALDGPVFRIASR